MRALSLQLIRGKIDEVDATCRVEWVPLPVETSRSSYVAALRRPAGWRPCGRRRWRSHGPDSDAMPQCRRPMTQPS